MKRILTFVIVTAFIGIAACAQDNKESRPSPAAKATGKAGNATITIDYSQPSVKGRKVFGDLVPYGKVWRTGANEATVFDIDSDIKVEGKTLPKGKYGLFTIPGENEWTIIFNKTWNQWGSFRYVQEDDVLRVQIKPTKTAKLVEMMTISVSGGSVTIAWENTSAGFKVTQ
jgi:Protein of unknown function (DUF2911)